MTNNDPEITRCELILNGNSPEQQETLSSVIRNGTYDAIITRAAILEDAARKLGWRALDLKNGRP